MTAVIGGISVFIEDDTARFQQSMLRNATLVEQQSQRMTRALGGTARSVDELNRRAGSFAPDAFRALAVSALQADTSIQRLRSSMLAVAALAGGGFVGAFATKALTDTADRYTDVQNKIAAVVTDSRERAAIEQQIYDTAQRTRAAYDATAILFQRLTLSASNLGASQSEILRVVETTQKALQSGGATTQEAAAAAIQLSQALGSGRLQGDELRSILENAPVLAQAIAKEFGVAVGQLKEMGSEGQLTSSRVFRALLKAGDEVDERFSQLRPTIASALVVLDNAFTRYIGSVDQSLGVSSALAQGIINLSGNLHVLGETAAVVAPLLAGVFAARLASRAGGAVTAPFREEFARRDEALAQARAAEQLAAERVVTAGSNLAGTRARARTDLDSFGDADLRRNRDQVLKGLEADTARLADAERKYQEVVARTGSVDVAAITRSSDQILRSRDFSDMRRQLSDANTELRRAEADAASAGSRADSTPAKVQLQDRLNKALQQEQTIRAKIQQAAYAERQNLREDISDLSEAPTKGTTLRERYQRQLENNAKVRADIETKLATLESEGTQRAADAAERLTQARTNQIQVERTLTDAVKGRLNAELGQTNRSLMGEVATANVARRSAASEVGVSRDLVSAANEELRQSSLANATRAVTTAQQQSTVAARGYAQAQEGVATAAARTGAATTVLSTALGLARTGFGSLIGFLGGPLGAAITAATTAFAFYEIAQARAAARAEEFKRATEGAAVSVRQLKEALTASTSAQNTALTSANQQIGTLRAGLEEQIAIALRSLPQTQAVSGVNEALGTPEYVNVNQQYEGLVKLGDQLDATKKRGGDTQNALRAMLEEIDRLSASSVDMAGVLGPLRAVIATALAGAEALRSLRTGYDEVAAARGDYDDARDVRERRSRQLPEDSARRADLNRARRLQEDADDSSDTLKTYMEDFYKKRADAAGKFDRELEQQTLQAAGKNIEARLIGLRQQYPGVSEERLRKLATLQDSSKGGGSKAKSEEEKFEDRLKRLQEEGRAAFFSDTDRALIEELKKIKGEPTLLRNTVDAIKVGGPLPEQAQRLRDALVEKEAGKEYRNIVQQYGNAAQILPQVNAEQEKLNMLLSAGKITQDQYGLALADTMGKFQNYKWVDQSAEAVANFAGEIGQSVAGFKNIDDVANSFVQTIIKLGIQIALVQPLLNMLRSGLAQASSGGFSPMSIITSIFGGGMGGDTAAGLGDVKMTDADWLHSGGVAGGRNPTRSFPTSVFARAPRFHKGNMGLGPDEIPAILQRGEPVLSRRTAKNLSGAIGALSEMQGGSGEMTVNVHPPPNTVPEVQKHRTSGGQSADVFVREILASDLATNGPLSQTMQNLYGLNRMAGKQS